MKVLEEGVVGNSVEKLRVWRGVIGEREGEVEAVSEKENLLREELNGLKEERTR